MNTEPAHVDEVELATRVAGVTPKCPSFPISMHPESQINYNHRGERENLYKKWQK